MSVTRATLNDGERLGGKYVVERMIAQGGMGEVYLAHHEVLGEPVAIKVLLAQYLHHDEALARFLNEAKAAAKIKSEHVARVTDVAVSERGMPYIVMEYLEGEDLERVVQVGGAMKPADAIDAVLQALDAVHQAHSFGMVHRDLKPSNLFRAHLPDGSHIIKVLDFGISKAAPQGTGSKLTATSSMLGSPMYTAPEQLKNARNATARSDIWSLGVILYELMSARLPYEGETLGELIVTMMERDPTPVTDFAPDLPEPIVQVIMRCLRRNDEERYEGVRELAAALEPFAAPDSRGAAVARRLASSSGPMSTGVLVPTAVGSSPPDSVRQPTMTEWSRSRGTPPLPLSRALPMWVWGAGAAAVALGLGLGARAAFSSPPPAVTAAPAAQVAPPSPPPVVEPVVAQTPVVAMDAVPDAGVAPVASAQPVAIPVRQTVETPRASGPKIWRPKTTALPPGTSSRK